MPIIYNQQPQGYQRPGSTASFAAPTAPQPPPYGVPTGYQSAAPSTNSQWAPPAQNTGTQWNQQPAAQQGSWGQQNAGGGGQPSTGGYNPGTYGPMPGAYGQSQQPDQPPPPPPKPDGYPSQPHHTHQSSQSWGQQNNNFTPQGQAQSQTQGQGQGHGQSGYPQQQQGGYQAPQQPYNSAAPPPPSQTPGGSYFPPSQGGRPGSIYGADQAGTFSTPQSAVGQQPPNSILSPNEQQPAYIPPSLTGQGVQSYMPANTNPMPGVYVPPPPDIPAWQQASHAPLQGGNKKFRYTKPSVDPSFYALGYQPIQPMAPTQQPGQYGQQPQQQQGQYGQQPMQPPPPPPQKTQQTYAPPSQPPPPSHHHQHQPSMQAGQFVQPSQPLQEQLGQNQNQYQQQQQQQAPTQPYGQPPQAQQTQQPGQQYSQQGNQWQTPQPADQGYAHQHQQQQQSVQTPYGAQQTPQHQQQTPQWQPGHQAHGSIAQQYPQGQDQGIQAPKPLGRTGTTPPNFVNEPSPQSQPVSPIQHRQSMSFGSAYTPAGVGRTNSVSSIALGAIRNQQAQAAIRTSTPKPTPPPPAKIPTPPPPRDSKEKFSALGMGGPSDWEHFGDVDDEIDDEEYFVAKKDEKKNESAQTHSVELPGSQPSPPTTSDEWPTPPGNAAQPVPSTVGIQRRDTFQPTPPSGTPAQLHNRYQSPQSVSGAQAPPPQQSFVMGDAIVATQSPQPVQSSQPPPPPAQQAFVMGDGGWSTPKQGTPVPQQAQQPAPPAQQGFVMDDGGWVPPKQGTPAQQQPIQPPPAQQGFVMDDGGWSAQVQQRQQTPVQHQQHAPPQANAGFVMDSGTGWGAAQQPSGPSVEHVAELKAKDDAYELLKTSAEKEKANLRAETQRVKDELEKERSSLQAETRKLKDDLEKEKSDLRAEVERLKAEAETAKSHTAGEKTVLNEQIAAMKVAADQAKASADATKKEKDIEIERIKEDGEGKDDIIKERDATIADLRRQLEAEKSREPPELPQPTPGDLIPDIDPWYAGSLERYIGMLRGEATEPQVEDKIKVFKSFLRTESSIRGLPYYDDPPAAPAPQVPEPAAPQEPIGLSRGTSNASNKRQDIHVQVPQQDFDEESFDYSPGGRPIIHRKPTLKSNESVPTQQSFAVASGHEPTAPASNHSTAILTPTSSTDDDFNKTPIQSPPEEPPQPQYKAYVPPSGSTFTPIESSHRQSVSFVPPTAPLPGPSPGKHDEIFFGEAKSVPKPTSRPTTSTSTGSDVPIPAPLSFTPQRSVTPSVPKKEPLEVLAGLLPAKIASAPMDPRVEEIRKKSQALVSDFSFVTEKTVKFDKEAALTRKKNDQARRKRQEESEAQTDQLFNDNEIVYADIGDIEDEFKEKERNLKAKEDKDEYKSYVEQVFDDVYDGLQADVKTLMDLYVETEALLHSSVSGVQALSGNSDVPTTHSCLELLRDLHTAIEARHERIAAAVSERDKRYKKTEVQPLYAAGNITKMKSVEKQFDNAEKQAVLRSKNERVRRVDELVRITEDIVVRAVGTEQEEIDSIIAAIRALDPNTTKIDEHHTTTTVNLAHETLLALKKSSKDLLTIFKDLEIDLNTSVLEAEISQARADGADTKRVADLEREMQAGERKLKEEFERRVGVLEQDREEVERLVEEKGGRVRVRLSGEEERQRRLRAALEEAKRRNGEL